MRGRLPVETLPPPRPGVSRCLHSTDTRCWGSVRGTMRRPAASSPAVPPEAWAERGACGHARQPGITQAQGTETTEWSRRTVKTGPPRPHGPDRRSLGSAADPQRDRERRHEGDHHRAPATRWIHATQRAAADQPPAGQLGGSRVDRPLRRPRQRSAPRPRAATGTRIQRPDGTQQSGDARSRRYRGATATGRGPDSRRTIRGGSSGTSVIRPFLLWNAGAPDHAQTGVRVRSAAGDSRGGRHGERQDTHTHHRGRRCCRQQHSPHRSHRARSQGQPRRGTSCPATRSNRPDSPRPSSRASTRSITTVEYRKGGEGNIEVCGFQRTERSRRHVRLGGRAGDRKGRPSSCSSSDVVDGGSAFTRLKQAYLELHRRQASATSTPTASR